MVFFYYFVALFIHIYYLYLENLIMDFLNQSYLSILHLNIVFELLKVKLFNFDSLFNLMV